MTAHNLVDEFPEYKELIHKLKVSDAHFAKLFDHYHELNRKVERAADRVEPLTQEHESQLHRERLYLKDQLFELLKQAKAAA